MQIEPSVLVVFGATGDLMAKKIVPAIYSLYKDKLLPEKFKVIGFARRDFNGNKFLELIQQDLTTYLNLKSEDIDNSFYKLFIYQQGQLDEENAYKELAQKLMDIDAEFQSESNKSFYF